MPAEGVYFTAFVIRFWKIECSSGSAPSSSAQGLQLESPESVQLAARRETAAGEALTRRHPSAIERLRRVPALLSALILSPHCNLTVTFPA